MSPSRPTEKQLDEKCKRVEATPHSCQLPKPDLTGCGSLCYHLSHQPQKARTRER
ncbi:hypothetical protein DPMN_181524 [Dreissena polymorpha]|uniref:Uncharacterized protein n=1 Tax=Dreissena polymorpha TaxID=45954 RepID=A0A9D4I5E1_DREPO|nr:hypothetical protein DPMN_181524 [Dreissena polymorpha]